MEEKYAGIIFYKFGKTPEFLLINDSYSKKKFWAPPKGKIIGQEDELQCAIREANAITGLVTRDFQIEEDFRAEIKYLSETKPKHVVIFLAQLTDPTHRIYPTGDGIHFSWLPIMQASEKAYFKNMQDVLSQAQEYIEEKKAKFNNSNYNSYPPNYNPNYQKNYDMGSERRFKRPSHDEMNSRMGSGPAGRNPFMKSPSPFNQPRVEKSYRPNMMGGSGMTRSFSANSGGGYSNSMSNGPFGQHNPGYGNSSKEPFGGIQSQENNYLYKTRLCERFESEGACPYGNKCHFAHGAAELRTRVLPTPSEDQYSSQSPMKDQPNMNPLYKTRLCERYLNEKYCQYGSKCIFAHGYEELRGRQNEDEELNRGMHDMNIKGPGPRSISPSHAPFRQSSSQGGSQYYPHSALHKASYTGVPPHRQQFNSQQSSIPSPVKPISSSAIKPDFEPREIEKVEPEPVKTEPKVEKKKEPEKVLVKDFLGSQAIDGDKSWMKVVELTSDEKEKLESLKAMEKRSSPAAPKQYLDDPVIISLSEYFREGEHDLKDEIKEITRLEFKHDLSKQQLFNVLIPSLFDESYSIDKLKERKDLFMTFNKSTNDQLYILKSWEKYLSCARMSAVLSRTPVVFKDMYDIDLVEEDIFLSWYDESPDSSIVKQKCEPFITWLKTAEEDSESD